jgi:hypothetical protein
LRQETYGKEEENRKLPQKETRNGRILVYKTKEGLGTPPPSPPHIICPKILLIFSKTYNSFVKFSLF